MNAFENISMSVLSMAHRVQAIVDEKPESFPKGELMEDDPDRTLMDPEICDMVNRFIETCQSPSAEAPLEPKDEGIVKPTGKKQKTVYHLAPFSELFNTMICEWSKNPKLSLDANFYVERVPDSDSKCSREMDALLVEFVNFNLTRPAERSDWCVIESPLANSHCFHYLFRHAFFKTTLTETEISTKKPKNEASRRQTRFVMKDDRAVLSLQDTHAMLHAVCDQLGLVIVDNFVYVTRLTGNRVEHLKYTMVQFINGDVEKACWIDCTDYRTTFRIHCVNDSIVNTVNVSYFLEHIEDVHPQFSIHFEHLLHFPRVSFKLEKNVEYQFNPHERL